MKKIWGIALSFYVCFAQAQTELPTDNNPVMTALESDFLKQRMKHPCDTCDFTGKRVAFVTGTSSQVLLAKQEYYEDLYNLPVFSIVELSPEEKQISGGYDYFVLIAGVKLLTPRRRMKLCHQLKVRGLEG